jgi:hypothetical protein
MGKGTQKPALEGRADVGLVTPLSALLSQALVAFTVELDNEFERRMQQAGYPGARLSLVVWSNLMRFLTPGDLCVRDLAARAWAPEEEVKIELGCLERWRFVELRPDPSGDRPLPERLHNRTGRLRRDGWGSGRGIRFAWIVALTAKGRQAGEIWPSLPGEIERRWSERFGADRIDNLRQALAEVVDQLDFDLPQGLPPYPRADYTYPPRSGRGAGEDSLPVLLSQLLLAFTLEFDRESRVPLRLCANILRVLGEDPVPSGEIPRLTGGSPETSAVGWEAKPYVALEPDPVRGRGKVARLTPLGLRAKQIYHELMGKIEERWQARFGKERIGRIRGCLGDLFTLCRGPRLLLAEGLVPPEGTVRAGEQAPALGRRDVGAAARQRRRDLVAQTELFVRDPVNTLPRYPCWDMNRGFGP